MMADGTAFDFSSANVCYYSELLSFMGLIC